MRSIRRILVAVKEPAARATPAAVNKAVQLARALGARLELFHALTAPIYADTFIYGDRSFSDVTARCSSRPLTRLERLATRLKGHGRQRRLKISVAAEWDSPAYEAIIRRAQTSKADLIVAERHAGRHIAAALLHLNDWELLRLSPVPVLLVKSPRVYDRPVVLAAVDPSHQSRPSLPASTTGFWPSVLPSAPRCADNCYAVHAYVPVPGGRSAHRRPRCRDRRAH
jgi:nucleotide-binding universal stress UspA family protein